MKPECYLEHFYNDWVSDPVLSQVTNNKSNSQIIVEKSEGMMFTSSLDRDLEL